MRAVAAIAERRGAEADLAARLDQVLTTLGYTLTDTFDAIAVRDAMLADKKRRDGRQRWILPMAVGSVVEVDDVTDDEIDAALETIAA